MHECVICEWVGDWEDYSDVGVQGYLCAVCSCTDFSLMQNLRIGPELRYLMGSIAMITNVLCEALHIDFGALVEANQNLLRGDDAQQD